MDDALDIKSKSRLSDHMENQMNLFLEHEENTEIDE